MLNAQVFKELVKLMHPSSSYKKYREALRKSAAPAIPFLYASHTLISFSLSSILFSFIIIIYLFSSLAFLCVVLFRFFDYMLHLFTYYLALHSGTYLQDLTFIEDGNPDMINGEINFKKREQIYQSLQEVQLYQAKPYDFPVVEPISTFLTDLPFLGEKELHELSLMLEPRDCELNQIVQ